jgi:P pilus assembly chaperone PapD
MKLGVKLARVAVAVAIAAGLLWSMPALAQLSVSPTYLSFDDASTTKAITVKNVGNHEEVMRVSLIDLRMLPDGRMVRVTAPAADEHFADGMIRFAPQELVLEPGASEVVRLQAPPPSKRPPGEYRTHVLVQRIPDTTAIGAGALDRREDMDVDLQAVFGVAVPLLIRHGKPQAQVSIGAARLETTPDGGRAVALSLLRSGERSVRGEVALLSDGEVIERVDGIAIYAPAQRRDVTLQLPASVKTPGALEVRFREDQDQPGALEVHAPLATQPKLSELTP